jgi:hypothetical protein
MLHRPAHGSQTFLVVMAASTSMPPMRTTRRSALTATPSTCWPTKRSKNQSYSLQAAMAASLSTLWRSYRLLQLLLLAVAVAVAVAVVLEAAAQLQAALVAAEEMQRQRQRMAALRRSQQRSSRSTHGWTSTRMHSRRARPVCRRGFYRLLSPRGARLLAGRRGRSLAHAAVRLSLRVAGTVRRSRRDVMARHGHRVGLSTSAHRRRRMPRRACLRHAMRAGASTERRRRRQPPAAPHAAAALAPPSFTAS